MSTKIGFVALASVTVLVIGILFLGSVPRATAETLNFKMFNHTTKLDEIAIPDVEGHIIGVQVLEGVTVLEKGELGWSKVVASYDQTKGAGTLQTYFICTFPDGSTFIVLTKRNIAASPRSAGSIPAATGDIIHGTGRFQGIKGTMTLLAKVLPPEKGELGYKSLAEGTLTYTLPGK